MYDGSCIYRVRVRLCVCGWLRRDDIDRRNSSLIQAQSRRRGPPSPAIFLYWRLIGIATKRDQAQIPFSFRAKGRYTLTNLSRST